jgi:hypothetical protein
LNLYSVFANTAGKGWWVVRIPEKGRSVRLALEATKERAEAFRLELEQDERKERKRSEG